MSFAFSSIASQIETGPIDEVKDQEGDGHAQPAPLLHGVGRGLPVLPQQGVDDGELQDADEDEEDAHDHPDVQEGDVGDARHVLADGAEHGRQGEECRHAHAHSAWNIRKETKRSISY